MKSCHAICHELDIDKLAKLIKKKKKAMTTSFDDPTHWEQLKNDITELWEHIETRKGIETADCRQYVESTVLGHTTYDFAETVEANKHSAHSAWNGVHLMVALAQDRGFDINGKLRTAQSDHKKLDAEQKDNINAMKLRFDRMTAKQMRAFAKNSRIISNYFYIYLYLYR